MRALTILLAIAAAGVCMAGYADLLSLGWIGQDSVTAVETSRFHDLEGGLSLFNRSLMQDTGFIFTYYRPVICLSFGLNYLLFGSDPWGYHLVDLLILTGICLCVYAAGLWMPRRNLSPLYLRLSAFAAALLFAAHTVNLTVTPVVARRSEGQLVLFGFAGLVLVLLACRKQGAARILCFGLALISLALSTLSKEAGILFLPPAVLLVLFCLRSASLPKNLLTLLAAGGTAALLGFCLIKVRGSVIQIPAGHSIHMSYESLCKTTWDYILNLVYPVRFLGFEGSLQGRWMPMLLGSAAILALGGTLLAVLLQGSRILRNLGRILGSAAGLGLVLWLVKGAASHPFDTGEDPSRIWEASGRAMGWPMACSMGVLAVLTGFAGLKRFFAKTGEPAPADSLIALSTWLICAWIVVSMTGLYTYRNTLGPAAAFSLLLLLSSDHLVEVFKRPAGGLQKAIAGSTGLILALLVSSIFFFSHPLQQYREWRLLDEVATPFLEGVIEAAEKDGLENINEILLEGVPGRCLYSDRFEKCVALAGFEEYTLKSWFKLRLPQAPPVKVVSKRRLKSPGERVKILSRREGGSLFISAEYKKNMK